MRSTPLRAAQPDRATADPGTDFLAGDSETARLMASIDWAQTPLGPPSQWSPSLRMMVPFVLANRFPHLLWWGPDYIQIYNDAYIPVLGTKHPDQALGKPFRECWHEVYDALAPLVDTPFNGGPPTWIEDLELIVQRHGFPEESHFTIAYSPVPDETAPRGIGGVLATVHEITDKVIGQRRVGILSELSARLAEAKTDEDACRTAVDILAKHPKDLPFALVYLLDEASGELRRVGATGIADELAGPSVTRLDSIASGLTWPVMLALRTGAAQTIETLTEVLSQVPAGPWAYTPQSAIALPIKSNVPHRPAGALVLGISACIRFDPLYSSFLELLAGQIATAVANARAYAEEHRRAAAGRIQSSFAPVDLATLTADLSSTFRSAMERAGLQFEVECEPTRTYVQEALRWRRESERRETQEALKRQHELEAADRHKNEFLAMLAHELRNPLAPIRNANELLLRRFADDPSVRDTLGTVSRQVTHLTRLVDDLLDISRITLGHIDLRRRAVALADLVNRAIETIDPLLRQKGLRIAVVSSRQPLVADADPERITQCIGNILTNAVKYTDAPGEIRIETGEVDGQARVTVTDNGVGISSELLPRVFDLFVQGECTLDRSQGGLGIGLSIVRRIVEMHGGSVSVRSPGVNKGATFEIRLPLAQHAETHAGTRAANAALPSRILVVDDNADAARTLSSLLALDGHTVQIAFAGPQALEGVESFSPDVVLLDIGLPGIDGYEVARRIRDHHPRPIHLVALTGYGQEADRERARAAGFADHLVKPVEYSKLQQTLAAITAGSCRDK